MHHFDERMCDKWSKHTATLKNLPTYQEIVDFFQPLEFSMAEYVPMMTFTPSTRKTIVPAVKLKTFTTLKVDIALSVWQNSL